MGSSGGLIFRSTKYPALTRFYKGWGTNYNPYVYCPGCGSPEDRRHEKVIYLCGNCGGEFYWSHYDKVVFIEKGYLVDVYDDDQGDEMRDGIPTDKNVNID